MCYKSTTYTPEENKESVLTYEKLMFMKAYIEDGDMRGLSIDEFKEEWKRKNATNSIW